MDFNGISLLKGISEKHTRCYNYSGSGSGFAAFFSSTGTNIDKLRCVFINDLFSRHNIQSVFILRILGHIKGGNGSDRISPGLSVLYQKILAF